MPETKLVIGIDEVGYGPNLGPLVIAATAWRVPESFAVDSMSKLLESQFQPKPVTPTSVHIPIGDSKEIYRSHADLNSLAQGVDFLSRLIGERLTRVSTLLKIMASQDAQRIESRPWYIESNNSGDENIDRSEFHLNNEVYDSGFRALKSSNLELIGIDSRVIDEQEFNRQLVVAGNKSNILTETSLSLAKRNVEKHVKANERIEVYCDRHGGRKKYQAVLMHSFSSWESWFSTLDETPTVSSYETKYRGANFRIQFQVGGDAIFPSSAASIVAKFLRELLMQRWNRFWIERGVTKGIHIRPTAGYYVDAMRFAADVEPLLEELGIERDDWWRKK